MDSKPQNLQEKIAKENKIVADLVDYWAAQVPGYSLNDQGLLLLKKLCKQFRQDEIVSAIDTACTQYLQSIDGKITHESVEAAWSKIGGICHNRRNGREDLYYIRGILRKRCGYLNEDMMFQLLEAAFRKGIDAETLKTIAKSARCWSHWRDDMEHLLGQP